MNAAGIFPTLAAWLRRPIGEPALALFLFAVSFALSAWLRWADAGPGVSALNVASTAAQIALVLGGTGYALSVATRGRLSRAASLVTPTTLVTAWAGADALHRATFGAHLDRERLGQLYEALRSHAVKLDVGMLAVFCGGVVVVALFFRAFLVALTYLSPATRVDARSAQRQLALAIVAVLGVAGSGGTLSAGLPWGPVELDGPVRPSGGTDVASPFGGSLEDGLFAQLERGRSAVLAGPLSARSHPSVVIVHMESVRSDMLREDVMPNVFALSRSCIAPTHHYSTSNNTGSGMFGLLTGLPVTYYGLARRANSKPLPLQVLKKLGYSLSAYYSSFLSSYDGLCDLFFRDVVDHVEEERSDKADRADEALVERYVANVGRRDPNEPTFDYVVLESSHYDYAYPPAFERFTPSDTLGLGIRDGTISRDGINDELKPRALRVRNRYQNSILYADTLVQRIVAAWSGRRNDVIIVVTGDHGEAFWEHGTFGHGLSLSDEQVRVPFVMCVPGASSTRYTYSSHEDVFATIFDAMGLEGPTDGFVAGKSLLRFDRARDLAIFGYGLTGSRQDDRLGVAGDGLKVTFVNRGTLPTLSVFRDGDIELAAPFSADLDAQAASLKLRSVEERLLR